MAYSVRSSEAKSEIPASDIYRGLGNHRRRMGILSSPSDPSWAPSEEHRGKIRKIACPLLVALTFSSVGFSQPPGVEQEGSSIASPNLIGSMAHLAGEGNWTITSRWSTKAGPLYKCSLAFSATPPILAATVRSRYRCCIRLLQARRVKRARSDWGTGQSPRRWIEGHAMIGADEHWVEPSITFSVMTSGQSARFAH